jgi:type IV pilus assembly protein PilE
MTRKLDRSVARSLAAMSGFTVIELMITVAIIAILAAIAVPSYSTYVTQSRAKGASSDLVAMSLALENDFQKTLTYPTAYATSTVIAALPAGRTGSPANDFATWAPAEGAYYSYSVISTATSYTVTATATGNNINCTLSLSNLNVRTATGASCGFTSW